jgi:metal-responsive CopG/Arc/MetJ family transcriptional regulator
LTAYTDGVSKRVISVRLSEDLIAAIDAMTDVSMTRSDLIERALRLAVSTAAGNAETKYDIKDQRRYSGPKDDDLME